MRTIPYDDLTVGRWVTVFGTTAGKGDHLTVRFGENDDVEDAIREAIAHKAGSPVQAGVPLKVIAVCLPFVYVSALAPDGEVSGPKILDVRKVKLMKLDPSAPRAIKKLARQLAWEEERAQANALEPLHGAEADVEATAHEQ